MLQEIVEPSPAFKENKLRCIEWSRTSWGINPNMEWARLESPLKYP